MLATPERLKKALLTHFLIDTMSNELFGIWRRWNHIQLSSLCSDYCHDFRGNVGQINLVGGVPPTSLLVTVLIQLKPFWILVFGVEGVSPFDIFNCGKGKQNLQS